jgi:hypothetical protein
MRRFHLNGGWFFIVDEGMVRVESPSGEAVTIPDYEWASVVASMCSRGETTETYQLALRLHDGRLRIVSTDEEMAE